MSPRIPSAAKALVVVTAAGLLLSGCHTYRAYHGGPHYAAPGDGHKQHYHGKHGDPDRRYRHRHRHRHW